MAGAIRARFKRVNDELTGFAGPYYFDKGIHTCVIDSSKLEKRKAVLERSYGARLVEDGTSKVDPDTRRGQAEPVSGRVQPTGEGLDEVSTDNGDGPDGSGDSPEGSVPSGDGQQDTGDDGTQEFKDRLLTAINKLEVENDEHWTKDGRPRIDAVEKFYGSAGVTRGDVDAAAPGYTRPVTD